MKKRTHTPCIPTPFPCFCIGCCALAVLALTLWRMLS